MEEEKNITQKENNNKPLIIVIIILSIIIVGLTTFICYDKIIKKDSNKNNNHQEEINNKNEDKENEQNESKPIVLEQNELETLTNKATLMINYGIFQKYIPLNKIDNIPNDYLLIYASSKLIEKDTFTKTELEQVIKNVFGDEINITHKNIPCEDDNCVDIYLYNTQTETYTKNKNHPGHGGGSGTITYEKYIDSYKVNNIYTIKFKIIYSNICSDMCVPHIYYTSYNDSKNENNPIYTFNTELDELTMTEDLFKTIENKVPVTTFTYEKNNNGTYNLKSITIE